MKKYKMETNSKYNGIVSFLAVVLTVLWMVGIAVLLIYDIATAMSTKAWIILLNLIIYIPVGLLVLGLIWGLDNALKRINMLENILKRKINLNEKDYMVEITGHEQNEEQSE